MNYSGIDFCNSSNGEGFRVVIFLSGCSHKCKGCHNPQTWNPNNGLKFTEDIEKRIFDSLSKDYISGITFSGGDPLYSKNVDSVSCLINKIHGTFPSKTIWLYSGYTWEQIFGKNESERENNIVRQSIIKNCEVFIDGRYDESNRDIKLKWRGSSNQRVIDVQKTLKKGEISLWHNL